MQNIKISELKQHPRNNEFFDDINGEKWEEFLESIRQRGVIEPIVITPDKTIVSGHQRVRACKELGITSVMCDVHTYDNEDQILQDLLETNVRQRGDISGSAKKIGRIAKELERLYGVRNGSAGGTGSNQYSLKLERNNFAQAQENVANLFGVGVRTIQNYKLLSEMIPELDDLVETGIVTETTALAIMRQLSEEEQIRLISSMDTTKKITQREVQKYIDKNHSLKAKQIPDDYESTKKELREYKKECANLQRQFQDKVKELQDTRKQIEAMKNDSPYTQYEKKLQDSTLLFCSKVATFIEQVGGYVWLTEEINKIPEFERQGYIKSVHAIKAWADTMEYNINNTTKEIY